MYCITFFNVSNKTIQKAYMTRYEDVITFLVNRSDLFDFHEHFVKVNFVKGEFEE